MSSDYSRLIFDRKKHYSAVRMQQGRVLLDSDWNAQSDIQQDRLHKQTVDVIGKTGVPVHSDGFKLALQSDSELSISAGRMYVNGLLCELDESLNFDINNEGILIQNNEENIPYGLVHTEMEAGNYLIFLEAWQREITFLDDPQIREKALGDPDTTTRLQTTWQLRSATVDDDLACEDIEIPFGNIGTAPTGTMEARTVSSETDTNPCSFNQTNGFRRLENQLYRIEIQTGGNLSQSTFKWSRENASIVSNVLEITGSDVVKVNSLGRDEVLGFSVGDWVEFKNHKTNLGRMVNPLFQIEEINRSTMEISVSGTIDQIDLKGLKIVRWDHGNEGLPLSSSFVQIEDGIEVNFSEGTYTAGDYWQIPARTIDSSIEWQSGERKLPSGVKVSYAKIGMINISDGEIQSISDCRNLFPPLTELPNTGKGCCTYHVSPETGWEHIFNRIKAGEDAKICFDIGIYSLESTALIQNKGHLLVIGSGPGTVIQASNSQVALRFENCKSLDISNMTFRTNQVRNRDKDDIVSLKGGLTVVGTPSFIAEKLNIYCGEDPKPQASCITYYNNAETPGSADIRQCNLNVGFYQHGIIVINSQKTHIENNEINVRPKPNDFSVLDRIRADNRTRNAFVGILMTNFAEEPNSNTNETINFGNANLSFRTNPDLRNANIWQPLIRDNPPTRDINSSMELRKHLERTVTKIITSRDDSNLALNRFVASLNEQDPSIGYQGIVIGGAVATQISILRNLINGFLQGIHVGLSHRHESGEEFDVVNSVRIEQNYVKNILPLLHTHARHGIFVGNSERLFVQDNEIDLHRMPRAAKVQIDAIRIWGVIGRKGTIANNQIFSSNSPSNAYSVGIRVEPLENVNRINYWNVTWNSIMANVKYILPSSFFQKYLDTNG